MHDKTVGKSLAGRQGFKLGAGPVSNVVMARDFWFQALQSQAVTPLRLVHCRPPGSTGFFPRSWRHPGDVGGNFIEARAVHDARTPLNSVSMFRVMVAGNALNMFEPGPAGRA